jgi:hypothetical protein
MTKQQGRSITAEPPPHTDQASAATFHYPTSKNAQPHLATPHLAAAHTKLHEDPCVARGSL